MHQARSLIEASRAAGMQTMDRALEDLFERGVISREEAMRFVGSPRLFGSEN